MKKVLTAAGATFDDVVEMVTYHTDMRDLQLFISVKDRASKLASFRRSFEALVG